MSWNIFRALKIVKPLQREEKPKARWKGKTCAQAGSVASSPEHEAESEESESENELLIVADAPRHSSRVRTQSTMVKTEVINGDMDQLEACRTSVHSGHSGSSSHDADSDIKEIQPPNDSNDVPSRKRSASPFNNLSDSEDDSYGGASPFLQPVTSSSSAPDPAPAPPTTASTAPPTAASDTPSVSASGAPSISASVGTSMTRTRAPRRVRALARPSRRWACKFRNPLLIYGAVNDKLPFNLLHSLNYKTTLVPLDTPALTPLTPLHHLL
ncbi:hypothetical protein B0H13DRAFT_1889036 [Mycena leptocephala]|nr:hypothetical protein B0H13DRAFT_1889036 [Mycena leptocephala]